MEETYLTVKEVADKLRVTRQAIYNWISEGRLKAVKVGGKSVRIPASSIAALIQPLEPGEIKDEDMGPISPALLKAA